jgi:hypothetical protein
LSRGGLGLGEHYAGTRSNSGYMGDEFAS